MYFAVNFPREFSPDGASAMPDERADPPLQVCHSEDGELLAVLRPTVLHLWSCHPLTLLTSYARSDKCVQQHGVSTMMAWGPDCDEIAVATSSCFVLMFALAPAGRVNELSCGNAASTSYAAVENSVRFAGKSVPLRPSTGWAGHKITAIASCKDSLLVATAAGAIERLSWETRTFDAAETIVLQDARIDGDSAAAANGGAASMGSAASGGNSNGGGGGGGGKGGNGSVYVVHMACAPSLRALAVVLSDGTAAVALAETASLSVGKGLRWLRARPAGGTKRAGRATCVALNPRFRLVAVGHECGEVATFAIEAHAALAPAHTLGAPGAGGVAARDDAGSTGGVTAVSYSADGYCVAVGWRRGGVGTWSVFGSRLMSLEELDAEAGHDRSASRREWVTSLSWGPEGYDLSTTMARRPSVVQYQFVKSALVSNSTLANQLHVALHGEDRICISGDMGDREGRYQRGVDKLCDLQWQMIQIPDSYLWANWPIRYVAVDDAGRSIAVAGSHGVAHYSVASRKWRLFGNESQERALRCSGGLAWWNDLLIVPCVTASGKSEVRFYPRGVNLDNRNVVRTLPFGREVLYLNVCGDRLLVYTASRRVHVFVLQAAERAPEPHAVLASASVSSIAVSITGSLAGTPPATPTPPPPPHSANGGRPAGEGSRLFFGALSLSSPRTPSSAAAAAAAQGSPLLARRQSPGGGGGSGGGVGQLLGVELECEISLKEDANHSSQVISLSLLHGASGPGGDEAVPRGLIANVSGNLLLYAFESDAVGDDDEGAQLAASVKAGGGRSGGSGGKGGGAAKAMTRSARGSTAAGTFAPPALLATGVENFWMRSPTDPARLEKHLAEALWLGCGAGGMQVWLPLYPPEGAASDALPKRVMLPFELDIYPLSVLLADAVVLGAAHDAVGYHGRERPFFAVARKTQPYLHHILRQLLRRNEDDQARRIARSCAHLTYFPHVLELMLHKVLEEERSTSTGELAQLPRVARFLEEFPFFLETVAACARKSDVAKWGRLFAATGAAEELFERCIVSGQLHTASSYLLVLQSLQSPAASQQHALRILRLALAGHKWDLAKDLIRFLQATAGYVPVTEQEVKLAKQAESTAGRKDTFLAALCDHALSTLRAHRLRALGVFAAKLHFPLLRWLTTVRAREGLSLDAVPALDRALADFGPSAGQPPTTVRRRGEAVYLLNIFFAAKFFDWAFLLALLLLDEPSAARVLEEVAVDASLPDGVFGVLQRFRPVASDPRLAPQHAAFYERLAGSFRPAAPIAKDLERERPDDDAAAEGQCMVV